MAYRCHQCIAAPTIGLVAPVEAMWLNTTRSFEHAGIANFGSAFFSGQSRVLKLWNGFSIRKSGSRFLP
ncbi:hypothetical protein EMIT0P43_130170 [Pseudomonas jessenii]